ncbi:hypothetical protein TL16_g04165 [Triparma laevis f. inornata]|uniref:Uncharacterized protein n=1 Tax=Triparma laevis f. inornata TaxID=1714386 RepID=A0A9W7A3T9_9STRA|nr:hypothetical protein TL16_g04165 [Triparma laevis f. inornata]
MAANTTSYTNLPIPLKGSGSSIVSSAIDPSGSSCYTVDTNGILSAMWAKSGGVKASFGEGGYADTKSQYVTSMSVFADDFGSGSILTGGGYEIMGSPNGREAMTQGIVKQWDLVRGTNVATYMGGRGLVRCLGIPGRTQDNSATIVPIAEEKDEEEEEQKREKKNEDNPYADDPTWGAMEEDPEEEAKKKRRKEAEKEKKFRPNGHRLTTFVSGGDDRILRVWDCVKTCMTAELEEDGVGAIKNIATCEGRHGLVLTGHRAGNTSMNGDVCIWDINGRLCMNKLKDVHVSEVNAMALSPCGLKLFTAGGADDPTMKEWDLRMMKKVKNVGFHKDRIQALGLLTTPGVSYLTHASKDGTNGLTAVTKSGVIRSKQVAEMDDFQGWSTHVSLVPMKLGDVKFAGGQKRKSTPDIFTVGTDRQLRQYDLSDFIKLSDPKTASELPEGGVERDFSKMKLNAEDNYHKQQSDFWDSFPSSEEVHGAAMKAKAKKEEEKDDGVARDKYGNEVGSIEYWVAKGNEPKRPKIGDIVVLSGDNAKMEGVEGEGEGEGGITDAQKEILKVQREAKAENLPDDAKEGVLKSGKADLGIITKDDNSGVPFEILSGLTGEKGWYEESHVEIANIETIKRSRKQNDISVASLKTGEVKKEVEENKKNDRQVVSKVGQSDDDLDDEEALGYYQQMHMRGGGHGGWSGEMESEQKESSKQEKKEETKQESKVAVENDPEAFSLSKFKPPTPPVQSADERQAEAERQAAVAESMAIYLKKKGAGGKRQSRF